jgi:hypothetical protein
VYSTCIHCNESLGRNESIESFPVGRRLAFDAAKGRLWVVCRKCERWNLSPLDERWEAIEECERQFRDTRVRVSTDEIGLARLREGLELVRIGKPMRPEFAAWRYGDQFGRRRNRQLLMTAGAVGVAGAAYYSMYAIGGGFLFLQFGQTLTNKIRKLWGGGPDGVIGRTRLPSGEILEITRATAESAILMQPREDASLHIRIGSNDFVGADAARLARIVLPQINRYGGSRQTIRDSVAAIEERGGPGEFLIATSTAVGAFDEAMRPGRYSPNGGARLAEPDGARSTGIVRDVPFTIVGPFGSLRPAYRLAFEMALHEEQERRAMEGELSLLEDAWREAEEVAGIADALFVPQQVNDRLTELSRVRRSRTG